ncbi:MAG: 50S ribosomal protein L6 [Actinomycetota bacterium]
MSRVGKKPIIIPGSVEVQIEGSTVRVKGPKGELSKTFYSALTIKKEDNKILVKRPSDNRLHKSLHGLTRTLIANMITGVSSGFEKTLEIEGVGYRAIKKGDHLELQVGFSHPVIFRKPEGIQIEVPHPTRIVVKGADKELVGEVAAQIRAIRKPEPYKGKGIRYLGEHVRRKVGKTAK